MSLAEAIKNAREDMTIERTPSRAELADKVGVTSDYLRQLEAGAVKSASIAFLKRYSNETGVPIEKFINEIEVVTLFGGSSK